MKGALVTGKFESFVVGNSHQSEIVSETPFSCDAVGREL